MWACLDGTPSESCLHPLTELLSGSNVCIHATGNLRSVVYSPIMAMRLISSFLVFTCVSCGIDSDPAEWRESGGRGRVWSETGSGDWEPEHCHSSLPTHLREY